MTRSATRVALLALLALLAAGCGAQAFEPHFAERQQPEMSRIFDDVAAAPARVVDPVIAAVTRAPSGILLFDLRAASERWRIEADVRSTPIVAGDHLVTTEGTEIVVRRLADGARVLAVGESDQQLIGADGEAGTLVVALGRGEGDRRIGTIVGVRDGGVAWAHELPLSVGVPAVVGPVVIVPWAQQRLSFLDATTGVERFRTRTEHAVVGYAIHHGTQVLVGQHRLLPFTPELLDDERQQRGGGLEPEGRSLPGQPPLLPDAYEPRMDADSARNRVRLAFAISGGAGDTPAAFADDALYYVFYRMVFGLATATDDVRWVSDRGHDVVGAAASPGGLVVVTDDGHIAMLSAADGHALLEADLGVAIRAADVRASGLAPPASATAVAVPPLRDQLHAAATLRDARMGTGRALAVRFLARDASAEVTAQLIGICSDRSDTSPARSAACEQLATRTDGEPHVLASLREGGSFLEQRPSPPVGSLARAAASMNMRQALPYLVRHLEDPSTPVEELAGLFDGLARLGDPRAVAPIEAFVRLYHADATDGATIEAVGAAAEALVRLSATRVAVVQSLADDPLAAPPVRARLVRALAPPAAAPVAPVAPVVRAPEPEPEPEEDLPALVTTEICETVLRPVQPRLMRCLEPQGAEPLPSARIVIMLSEEGAIQTVSVTPEALLPCVEPLVRARTFPRTQRGRQVVVHTLRR